MSAQNQVGAVSVRVGDTVRWRIYGHLVPVRVMRADRWSMDVERLSDGRCFRLGMHSQVPECRRRFGA